MISKILLLVYLTSIVTTQTLQQDLDDNEDGDPDIKPEVNGNENRDPEIEPELNLNEKFLMSKILELQKKVEEISAQSASTDANKVDVCGNDWIAYSGTKCLRVLDSKATQAEAKQNCSLLDSTSSLVTIDSGKEQEFLSRYLKTYRYISDSVWIGLRFNGKQFEWADGSQIQYRNWGENFIGDGSGGRCGHMSLSDTDLGKWTDDHCNRKYLIVCQKEQLGSDDLVSQVANLNKTVQKHQNELDKLKNRPGEPIGLTELKADMRNIKLRQNLDSTKFNKLFESVSNPFWEFKRNFDSKQYATMQNLNDMRLTINQEKQDLAIPIGFIYIQLPFEKPPSDIWPTFTWKDVSDHYQGIFFRVNGGGAAQFGRLQDGSAPNVRSKRQIKDQDIEDDVNIFANGQPFYSMRRETSERPVNDGQRLPINGGEVRPKNMAVKIWKRIF